MRFLIRGLTGLALLLLTAALIGVGALDLIEARREAAQEGPPAGPAAERVFAVEVLVPRPETIAPTLTAYGEIVAARRLELRPALAGRLSELSDAFHDGGEVEAGELLFRLDPADATSALRHARIALTDAEVARDAALRTLTLTRRVLAATERRETLQTQAMERQRDLLGRRVGSTAAVETAELNLAAAQQARIDAEQALASAQTAAQASEAGLERAALEVDDAQRALDDTEVRAPFAGLLTETAAVLGRQVAANEKLGALIDPTRMEAALRVSNAEFARLLDEGGVPRDIPARLRLDLGETDLFARARLARVSASAGPTRAGRMLYFSLAPEAGAPFREGDFVAAEIQEPPLQDVAVIPAAAATEDGRVLIVDGDDRLRERQLRILRRLGDRLIVADAPFGERMVAIRKPQLGAGARARVAGPGAGNGAGPGGELGGSAGAATEGSAQPPVGAISAAPALSPDPDADPRADADPASDPTSGTQAEGQAADPDRPRRARSGEDG